MEVNVAGYANCIRHAGAAMKSNRELTLRRVLNDQGEGTTDIVAGSKGSIVNVASISSFIAQPEFVPYNCSKAAIVALTRYFTVHIELLFM